nr:C-type lectin domain family 3 member A-like isoform X2 [Drosophila takahashii]
MRAFLIFILFGVLVEVTFGRGLYSSDLERRLVTLEARQFADNDAFEDRIRRLEIHLPIQRRLEISQSNPVDSSSSLEKKEHVDNEKIISDRLDKLEDGLKKEFADQLGNLTSKFEGLVEKLPLLENKVAFGKTGKKFKKIGEKYYIIENDVQVDRVSAKTICSYINGRLVSLQNEAEWKSLTENLNSDKNYWMDITDSEDEGKFLSDLTEKKASFLKWMEGEPNNGADNDFVEDCVEMRGDSKFYMNDAQCSNRANFICELVI